MCAQQRTSHMSTVSHQSDFETLLVRVRQGDQGAAWTVVELYGPHILRTVRRKLNSELRSKFDSQDFVQAVWASFFADKTKVDDIESPEQLIALLGAIARHKIIDQLRKRLRTQKYNVNRETSLNDSTTAYQANLTSQIPTPSDVVIAREQWDRLLAKQPEHYQQIVELRFRGETLTAIAEKLGLNEKTVRRVLARLLEERVP